ncbi:MAG: GTPase Era [Acidaminococcaceae bacterium]|nr:GTPase Era [Acidaminococcaceae bacterium]MDO4936181.1 GTPase Era [Phascolarctobacterium sp.]
MIAADKEFHSGYVAILGKPNVGKSTLMNNLIGEKIAIMSAKAQTTRNRIMSILNTDKAQIIFLDTPGIHKPHHKLGDYMVKTALDTLKDVDVVLFVVDVTEKHKDDEVDVLDVLRKATQPVILVLNKIDLLKSQAEILRIIDTYSKVFPFAAVVPLSALRDKELNGLVQEIEKHLPAGPHYFDDDVLTDQAERVIAGEMIREKILISTHDEVPHSVAVEVNDFKERDNDTVYIRATIYVERESQKGIIIGAKGSMLKNIGQLARQDIENLLNTKVFVELWVKVRQDWRNSSSALKDFGYRE